MIESLKENLLLRSFPLTIVLYSGLTIKEALKIKLILENDKELG